MSRTKRCGTCRHWLATHDDGNKIVGRCFHRANAERLQPTYTYAAEGRDCWTYEKSKEEKTK